MKKHSKMYILIRDDVDNSHASLSACHASLGGYLTFLKYEHSSEYKEIMGVNWKEPTLTEVWAKESFRKVLCRVTIAEFEMAKQYGVNMKDMRIITEIGLGGIEIALVFAPREIWSPFFKSLKLF